MEMPFIVKNFTSLVLLSLLTGLALVSANDTLPEIEARVYDVNPRNKSTSNRVYLFDHGPEITPKLRKIILLRDENSRNVMAFRTLKLYPSQGKFAARKVREYEEVNQLELDRIYQAIEKLRDLFGEDTEEDARLDQRDLQELEKEMDLPEEEKTKGAPFAGASGLKEFDPELDYGTSPLTQDLKDTSDIADKFTADAVDALEGEENRKLDSDDNWISLGIALLRNYNTGDSFSAGKPNLFSFQYHSYNMAWGLRYAFDVAEVPFYNENDIQDSLSVEGGFFNYRILDLSPELGNVLSIMSFPASVRYNVFLKEGLSIFGYAGFLLNIVTEATGNLPDKPGRLTSLFPAIGAGVNFRFGPKWYMRADFGLDSIGAYLLMRF